MIDYSCDHCGTHLAVKKAVLFPILNAEGTFNWSRTVQLCVPCIDSFLGIADAYVPKVPQ